MNDATRHVVRELREHYLFHSGGPPSSRPKSSSACPFCELWRAYTRRDLYALDSLLSSVEVSRGVSPGEHAEGGIPLSKPRCA